MRSPCTHCRGWSHQNQTTAPRCVRARHGADALRPQRAPVLRRPPQRNKRKHRTVLRVLAAVDRRMEVKISMAGTRGALDLSELDLEEVPPQIFNIAGLKELTLAGNRITELPPAISKLTSLQRLQLSGNLLTRLPDELGHLAELEGLWLHGNLLEAVPSSIGALQRLNVLSLAGNCLAEVPHEIGELGALTDLGLAGNHLTALPSSIGQLAALQKLACNGNALQQLPPSMTGLTSLKQLWLQRNRFTSIDSVAGLPGLTVLSVADNPTLMELPDLRGLTSLRTVELYGCGLTSLPADMVTLPSLRSLWLEGNPIRAASISPVLAELTGNTVLKDLGLDIDQVYGIDEGRLQHVAEQVRPGAVVEGGPGYFKIVRRQSLKPGVQAAAGAHQRAEDSALVVAFGSAPGVPNWAGLLKRVELAGAVDPDWESFDVLFVVDGSRSWYDGGDDGVAVYKGRLERVCKPYKTVVMLGDSMGATAALLFAPVATSVLAFCPQVDLNTSSIRPGKPPSWFDSLRRHTLNAVESAAARGVKIHVHCGSWLHDVDQARLLPEDQVDLTVHAVDSHRLAYHLDTRHNGLVSLVVSALKE